MKRPLWPVARATASSLVSAVTVALGVCLFPPCPAVADNTPAEGDAYKMCFAVLTDEAYSFSKVRIALTSEELDPADVGTTHLEFGSGETFQETLTTHTMEVATERSQFWYLYFTEEQKQAFFALDRKTQFFLEYYLLDTEGNWYVSGYSETVPVSVGQFFMDDISEWQRNYIVLQTAATGAVPEPTGGLLLLLGGGFIGLMRPRRRR